MAAVERDPAPRLATERREVDAARQPHERRPRERFRRGRTRRSPPWRSSCSGRTTCRPAPGPPGARRRRPAHRRRRAGPAAETPWRRPGHISGRPRPRRSRRSTRRGRGGRPLWTGPSWVLSAGLGTEERGGKAAGRVLYQWKRTGLAPPASRTATIPPPAAATRTAIFFTGIPPCDSPPPLPLWAAGYTRSAQGSFACCEELKRRPEALPSLSGSNPPAAPLFTHECRSKPTTTTLATPVSRPSKGLCKRFSPLSDRPNRSFRPTRSRPRRPVARNVTHTGRTAAVSVRGCLAP